MMNQEYGMQKAGETAVATERDIRTVTLEIKTLHMQAKQIIVTYMIEIGRRLVEAKSMLNHGEWGKWLENEVEFSQRSANEYMRIFEEFGASQMGLFGGEANSQTFANLSYSKALKLIAIPAEEREEFAKENHVEELSTRELDKLIRERDEARRRAQDSEAKAEQALRALGNSGEYNDQLQKQLEELKKEADELDEERATLDAELREMRSRPVEVAVDAADPKELEAARKEAAAAAKKEAEEALKKKIEAADKKRKDAEAELAKLKEKQQAAEAAAKAAQEQAQKEKTAAEEAIRREKEAAAARITAMEKELRAAKGPEIASFKIYFEAAQENFNKMSGCLKKLELAGDAAGHDSLVKAWKALAQAMLDNAPALMEKGGERDA